MSTGIAIFLFIIAFIGFLSVLTLIHELGHFTVAKLSKAKVAEFSIGFGPKMFQFKIGETTYSLR
jgi:regulator of sigma E protease